MGNVRSKSVWSKIRYLTRLFQMNIIHRQLLYDLLVKNWKMAILSQTKFRTFQNKFDVHFYQIGDYSTVFKLNILKQYIFNKNNIFSKDPSHVFIYVCSLLKESNKTLIEHCQRFSLCPMMFHFNCLFLAFFLNFTIL